LPPPTPLPQSVLHLRFRRAARLLRSLAAFRELLSLELLQRLALGRLLPSLLPQLRAALGAPGGGGDLGGLPLAVARAEAVVLPLPPEWLGGGAAAGAPPPREAAPLSEFLQAAARALELRRGEPDPGGARAALARRLGAVLVHAGLRQRGETLAAAYGARL
jgi:hypothetical protein